MFNYMSMDSKTKETSHAPNSNSDLSISMISSESQIQKKCHYYWQLSVHVGLLLIFVLMLFFDWLAFIEPLYPAKGWERVPSGCRVHNVQMSAIQGVVGNTDLIATAQMNYSMNGNTFTALTTRQIATIGPKEKEAEFIDMLLESKKTNSVVDCYVDKLNAYRVLLDINESTDGFIGFTMFLLSLAILIELMLIFSVYVNRNWWKTSKYSLETSCCVCFWPKRLLKWRRNGNGNEFENRYCHCYGVDMDNEDKNRDYCCGFVH